MSASQPHGRIKVGLLTTDNREQFKNYGAVVPQIGPAPDALLQGFALLPEAEMHVISCARAQMKSPSNLAPNIFFHSCVVPKLGWMSTAYQGTIRAVRRKLREIQPDVVHGQGTERDCAMNAVFSGLPNILTIHGNLRRLARLEKARPFSYLWLAARLEGFVIPRSNGILCISHSTQLAVSGSARRTWVVPNAVDPSFFEVEPQPAPGVLPKLLCVGLVCHWKNQNALIRALDPTAKKYKFQLVFLGNARPDQPYAAEFLELLKTRPWCVHAGFADRDKLRTELSQAHLLVLPSLEDNCPMVVLEAMAAGVPVLAAKIGGVPDLVGHGTSGWLCDPLDADSMRAGVEKALADPAQARQIANRARELARQRFHPRVIAQRHLEVYRELLSTPS